MSAIFVKLDASYHQDPKLLDLDDERAELLWVRGLTYCKTHLTDGVIHRRALPSFAPFQDDIAPADLAAMLVSTGAWREHPKGWIVPSWLDHNKAAADILTPSKGREMAHQRHHVNKGVTNPDCEFCTGKEPQVAADGCVVDADTQCAPQCADALPETETETPPPVPRAEQDMTQELRRAVALVAKVEAGDRADDGAWVGGIRREILTGPDTARLVLIRSMLNQHGTPEAVAAAWMLQAPKVDPLIGGFAGRPIAEPPRPPLAEFHGFDHEPAPAEVAMGAIAAIRGDAS